MNVSQFKHTVIDVISYGRFYNLLAASECICLHQWAQRGFMPTVFLRDKFYHLKEKKNAEKWERPEFLYNTQLKLTYRTKDMVNFEAVPHQY
jgi:hypothetical protein